MQPIFVGDVQGCGDEFEELLARARGTFGDDFRLWIVGDLLNRGPHNLRLLEIVRPLVEDADAQYVLGNHELGLLRVGLGLTRPRKHDTFHDILDSKDCAEWIAWLRRRPLMATGELGERRFCMVHAAVHPDWSLEDLARRAGRIERRLGAKAAKARKLLAAGRGEDPDGDALGLITRCRGIDPEGQWYPEEPRTDADAWHRRWARRDHDYAVVYGHWAMQGLHVAPRLRGLDTGCVHHGLSGPGFLTAWLPDASARDPFAVPDEGFWQIPARRRYRLLA